MENRFRLTEPERLSKKNQVKILRDDVGSPAWERSHLALFIADEHRKGDTRWRRLLLRADSACRRGDAERLGLILDEMERVSEKEGGHGQG